MYRARIFTILICATVFILGYCHCDKATGSFAPIPPSIPAGNFSVESCEFAQTPDSLILSKLASYCAGDSLATYNSNRVALHYSLAEPHLYVSLKDSVFKACTTKFFLRFIRASGSGLQGSWVFDSTWYEYKGNPTSTDSTGAAVIKRIVINYGYKWIMFDRSELYVYHDSDTTVFASMYIAQNKMKFVLKHVQLDSIQPNAVRFICVSYKGTDPNGIFDTLIMTDFYKAAKTVFRTSDTTKYSPDPFIYYKDSVCSKSLPPWWDAYLANNNKVFPN
jgi:hypothetical protein